MIATDKSRFGTIAAIGVGAVVTVALLFGATVTPTQAQTDAQIIQQLQQQIAALQSQLQSLVGGGDTSGGTAACTATFTTNMTVGSTGAGVLNLQKALNADSSTQLATSGAGSPGNETEYFGPITRAGVIKFQEKHSADVLAPVGLSSGTGYVGPSTRAKLNEICSGSTSDNGNQTPGTGTGVTVSSNSQPSNGLLVQNASRVPFTNFTVTNNGSSDVTINSVVVEKTGLIDRSVFDGVLLTDNNGVQLGDARSLNSNNQATIGRSVTIPAGATRTFTVAANAGSDYSLKAGQVGGLSVVSINTNASLSGSLPITGAAHTVNGSLSIGTADVDRGTNDPNTNRSLEIGSTDYIFSSVRVTAGSQEDLRLHSVRFTQNGSIDSSELANLMVDVDGTTYPVSVSGDEYTATFGGGILIEEGFSKDIAIRGDIVGNANGDTVQFDIKEASDIHVTGETFGFGITPTASGSGSAGDAGSQFTTNGNPFYDASQVTVTGGSFSTVSKSNAVPAQNVAINVANQPLGAFSTNLSGEGLEIDGITFGINTNGDPATQITSVTLVNENGSVVAGPVDGTTGGGNNGQIVFSDLIEFPTGSHTYTLKGRLSTGFSNGDTIQATTTVSSTYWTDPEGTITGDAYTLPGTTVNMNTMTVNAADLNISVGSTPAAQNVVAGASDFTFTNYILDTNSSGEDVRLSSLPLRATGTLTSTSTEINSCQLFDGSTALNTGSNVINGSNINGGGADTTFTFNNSLTVSKGTTKTLAMRCNISSGASGTLSWGIDDFTANPVVTGVQSGSSVSEDITTGVGNTMTIGTTGSVTVAVDSSDPSERWYVAGDEAEVGVFELLASNEAFNLRDIELKLNNASSSAADISEIALYSGGNQIVRKMSPAFTSNTELFSNLGLNLPKNDDTNLSVRVKFGEIGIGQAGSSGALVRFSTTTDSSNNEAQGVESGSVISLVGNVGDTTGARYFRSLPTIAQSGSNSGSLSDGSARTLAEFTITADSAGRVLVERMSFEVATTGAVTADTIRVKQLNGSNAGKYLNASSGAAPDGNNEVTVEVASDTYGANFVTVSAGSSITFAVEGDISGTTDNDSISTKMLEDTAYPSLASGLMGTASAVSTSNFVWSPRSTTSSESTNDWTNGFRVPGLEFSDLNLRTLSN